MNLAEMLALSRKGKITRLILPYSMAPPLSPLTRTRKELNKAAIGVFGAGG
jgi:hypothetical protein